MSSVRSASRVGPKRMHTLTTEPTTPTSLPAARATLMASLMTPRSAPSVRLRWVYHWYLVRLVRIACCGFAMAGFGLLHGGGGSRRWFGGGSAGHGSAPGPSAGSSSSIARGSAPVGVHVVTG